MHYVRVCVVVEIYVSHSIIQKYCHTAMLLRQICIAGNNKTHVGLHVKCRMLHWRKWMFVCSWPYLNIKAG